MGVKSSNEFWLFQRFLLTHKEAKDLSWLSKISQGGWVFKRVVETCQCSEDEVCLRTILIYMTWNGPLEFNDCIQLLLWTAFNFGPSKCKSEASLISGPDHTFFSLHKKQRREDKEANDHFGSLWSKCKQYWNSTLICFHQIFLEKYC